ncbi:MAG TPA: nodulation protein NfeD, partial [Azoarcus taiwanensis]|nr:nodulation protein NfeD [Azoarcus taiwanensis]
MVLLSLSVAEPPPQSGTVVTLRVDGAIGPATSDFITRGFAIAAERNAGLIIIEMDTPGGLDTSMRAIIKHILASPIPVATYVSPEGARAASAGTFILYASHIAAMAPATNLGAASPVAIGGPPGPAGAPRPGGGGGGGETETPTAAPEAGDEAAEADKPAARPATPQSAAGVMEKATSDAAAYIRSLAQLRGRDADFAERAVREAASLSASEALEAGVIDVIAISLTDLLEQLDGREIRLDSGNVVTLATAEADIERITPDWRNQFLSVISNPQIALILMMIGIYGLFFEF